MTRPVPFDRRELLLQSARLAGWLAGLGLLAGRAAAQPAPGHLDPRPAFQAHALPELMQSLDAGMPVPASEVLLELPDVAENGAVVPVRLAATLPGVARLLLLIERNPTLLSAMFEPSPAVAADFSLRVKMAESTDVYAVAMLADGRVLYAHRHCTVVLGGCG